MTRHSKVFVPVSEVSENSFSIYTAYSSKEKEWLLMEEKENVYVLSEQELKELLRQYASLLDVPLSSLTDAERNDFIQSKTNPQTENK